MAMAEHFNPAELRDPHGKWTRGGAALHRMVKEAEAGGQARGPITLDDVHKKVNDVANMPAGKGQNINKLTVTNMGDKGIRVRMPGETRHYKDPREAAVAVFRSQHHIEGHSPVPLPGGSRPGPHGSRPEVSRPAPPQDVNDIFRRGIQSGQKHEVIHPQILTIAAGAGRNDPAKAKKMRQQVLKVTTIQGQYTPDLVGKTQVTVTNTPHGRSASGTLASHTGGKNTLHVKPEVLIGNNAQAVLDDVRSQKWWVPTGKQHDLATNVMTHEFGHGVHGELQKRGIIKTDKTKLRAVDNKQEFDFWKGLAGAVNKAEPHSVQEPKIIQDNTGTSTMSIADWMFTNDAAIKRNVSVYGGTNQNEMFAELWTEYVLSDSPRPPAKYFGDFVMKALQKEGATG